MEKYQKERKKYLNQVDYARRKGMIHVCILGMVAVAVIGCSVVFTINMKIRDGQAVRKYVENYSAQRRTMLDVEIHSEKLVFHNLKEAVEQQETQADREEFLNTHIQDYGFEFAMLYDGSSGELVQAGTLPEGIPLKTMKEKMIRPSEKKHDESTVSIEERNMIYTTDLHMDGENPDVLLAGVKAEKIGDIITNESFDKKSGSFIMDGEGRILICSKTIDYSGLWNYVSDQNGDDALTGHGRKMEENLQAGQGGMFEVRSYGHKNYYLAYEPLEMEDWAVVTIVPFNLLSGFSDRYAGWMLVSLTGTLLLFGIYSVLLLKNYAKGEKRLEQLAFSDRVTGGINMAEFRLRYDRLRRMKVADQYVIVLLDCIDFKRINEMHGVARGDEMLRHIYKVIVSRLKESDGEFAARTEMDHMFLCLKEREPERIQRRMDQMIEQINEFHGTQLPQCKIAFRLGGSFVDSNEAEITAVLDHARSVLKLKGVSKNTCIFYDDVIEQRIKKERELGSLFETAVKEKEFQVYLQPQVSLSQEKVVSAEALVRWERPGVGLIPPGEFIPLLERDGKICILDQYIFENVCIWLKKRKMQGLQSIPVAVNLSRRNFMNVNFVDSFAQLAEEYDVDKNLIEFEVTETIFLDETNTERIKEGIHRMHQYGFRCAIDDFGVGYSSLTLIKELDIDVLKMDRAFFLDLDNFKAWNVAYCIAELARNLNIVLIAEGIETKEQIDFLKTLQCDIVQGYYFSRPLPIEEFERWMEGFEVVDLKKNKIDDHTRKSTGGGIQMLKIPTLIKRFCDALLEYDSETGRIFWYHNDRRPELCDAWSDYKDIYQLYRECYVCSDDLEIWDHFMEPDHMQHFVKGETAESHFYIRFENHGKGMEWHEIFMEKMEDSKVLIGSRDIRGIQRSAAITQAILPQFDYVCFIDTETEGYILYYQDASKTVLPENTSGDYHKVIEKFNRKYVVPEEAGLLTEHMKIGHVQQELQEKEEYILYATFKDQEKIFYKKLYFSYADATRKKLILIRTDVSDIVKERKLREREERKRIAYLEHMPVACVSAKVLLDENGDPYDFRLTYSNQAYAKLMETELQELLKKNFYEIFPKADRKRLKYYYETAYKGIAHVISWEVPEKNKHLLIHTFQIEDGCFGSVLVDITVEHFLTQELQKSREEIQRVLATTTDLVFQYCPETHEISLTRIGREEKHQIIPETVLIQKLTDRKWLESSCVAVLENGFRRMREGEHYLSVNLKARFGNTEKWTWYRMTMFDFQAEDTHERKIFGYLQNIHQDMMKQEKLKKKAQIDPLTRVLNAGAGRQNIQKLLESQGEKPKGYHAMFLMDIDDFKKINDTCGHLLGDRVLEIFGRILRKTFRKEDIVYRLGGDEFVAFVENMENPDRTIRSIMQRLNSHLGEMRKAYTYFSSSTGVYVTKERCSFEQYYTEADRALYETKKQGKGHYTIRGEME